ncbi:glycoside hydrolase family 17 protein [Coniophora puteana RWD-64-598 SS2]|uniref:glucan endo-1,3-beta-D-glucosidase n=1 Tax=Coniophora puteana (strain RWD-64-598) TaxID=741705 RepID=A0A5M3MU12_CONPW|nr:glycoside hydrolase family 17 protein [Coniophora puteana RWD-64-598 SS2]EIW82653.1 glycoside hydrolase family 17 protein [Coniophora puteana RWD-64-598 SS2]
MAYSLFHVFAVTFLLSLFLLAGARPTNPASSDIRPATAAPSSPPAPAPNASSYNPDSAIGNCFPALGFRPPVNVPSSLDNWWCDDTTEYAFMGFSYEVTACQSPAQLQKEFSDIRNHFKSRYVRLYGACDNDGFYDDIVEAAWNNGLGVHALVWFGFTGGDQWVTRRNNLVHSIFSNPKAPFVTRGVQMGSEPLYDSVLTPDQLANQVTMLKAQLKHFGIPVTVSELAYGYQKDGGAQNVLDAEDYLNIHMLPFFSQNASTSNKAWPLVLNDLDFFIQNGNGKKMYFDENGWPSVTSPSVQPNSPNAVANVDNEAGYFQLLNNHCEDLKNQVQGGVGWFAHIYSDNQEPGYGIYDTHGRMKFPFQPRTTC